ncbi:MAG: hypothetical protein LIR50_19695 [Bacillota bacterium]|nr:hypothetical protein [Bacillota bacterium]
MNNNLKFNVWYAGEKLGIFNTLDNAQNCIYNHPKYKKSYFTKKGKASSRNPNQDEYFKIYDSKGYGWTIRAK